MQEMANKYQLFAQYPSLISVLSVLKSTPYASFPEVQKLLEIYKNVSVEKTSDVETKRKHPFIVLEGLDGCGKSHTSKLIAKKLNGILKSTPPQDIISLREKFDSHDSLLRRAYYSLGNYIAELEIKKILADQPVVLDRFWHSTSAYAMANEIIANPTLQLPDEGDEIYCWPKDLIQPDIVIFLTVAEEKRLQRLSKRKQFTIEENELKKNAKFREILGNIYKNMREPKVVIVDNTETSVDESANLIVNMIK